MNLLVICPHFAPDVAPTGEVMTAIVRGLTDRGHRVEVVTALPWYRHHRIDDGWRRRLHQREATPWGSVHRLDPFPTDKANLFARALAFGGFTAVASWEAIRASQRPDAVLAMSPPLTLGIAGWIAARRWRVPFVFNIQDVFPDVAIEVGAIRNPVLIAVARWLERFLYRRSDAVTVLSEDLRANLSAKISGHRPERIRVIPNFVDTDAVRPASSDNTYRAEYGLGDRLVVMYAGNLGFSQSVDLLVEAAREFRDDPGVVFVVNGSGSGREALIASAADLGNIVFVGLQPRERLAEVLAAADVHTVLLKAGLARSSVPSKSYSILAAARPCLASVDPGTEVARMLSESGGGVSVDPDDVDGFVAALRRLLSDRELREEMGRSGRSWVQQCASPAAVATRYESLFEELIAARGD